MTLSEVKDEEIDEYDEIDSEITAIYLLSNELEANCHPPYCDRLRELMDSGGGIRNFPNGIKLKEAKMTETEDKLQKQIDELTQKLANISEYMGFHLDSPLSFSPKEKGMSYREFVEHLKKEVNDKQD